MSGKGKTQRTVSYHGLQTEANKVFAPSDEIPRLGATGSYAPLNVGQLIRVPKKGGGYNMERQMVEVPITHVNLAIHLGYDTDQLDFVAQAAAKGVEANSKVNKIIKNGSWWLFNQEVIIPLRRKYAMYGIESVAMWFYSCPRYGLVPDRQGNTRIVYSEEQPLMLLPKSLSKATARWNLSKELQREIAILTYWVTLYRLIPRQKVETLDEAKKVVEECQGFLPSGIFDDFLDASKQAFIQSREKKQLYLLG